jgi:hypothetical protein
MFQPKGHLQGGQLIHLHNNVNKISARRKIQFSKYLTQNILHAAHQWRTQVFFFCGGGGGGLTNSDKDRGQRERGSGDGSPLVSCSAQFANEWNPYSYQFVTDVFSTELEIRLSFVKTSEFRGEGVLNTPPPTHPLGTHCCSLNRILHLTNILLILLWECISLTSWRWLLTAETHRSDMCK